jgi:putative transposase
MRKSRFSEEQIIAILREQEAGARTEEVCRRHGVSSTTFYKWKARYGGLKVSEARRLKVLQAALGAKLPACSRRCPTSWRSSKQIRRPPLRNTRSWLPWSASAALWICSVRLSSWPDGGHDGSSAPPPSKRSGSRPWRISRLPTPRRRSTPCFSASIGAGQPASLSQQRGRRADERYAAPGISIRIPLASDGM